MKSATDIAKDKTNHFIKELIGKLDADLQALYRRQAAKKMLRSGNTFIEVMTLIKDSFSQLAGFISEQSNWVISESLVINGDLVQSLKSQGIFHLEQLHKHISPKLKDAAHKVGKDSLYERYFPEIKESLQDAYKSLDSAIDTTALERKNKGIRGIVKAIPNLIMKAFGK